MKAELVIEMEEECTTCPMIELGTTKMDIGSISMPKYINVHDCTHRRFCKAVRKNWEQWRMERERGAQ